MNDVDWVAQDRESPGQVQLGSQSMPAGPRRRILVAHNKYLQRGGEDVVFENETELLSHAGHDVRTLEISNSSVVTLGAKARALLGTAHNASGVAAVSHAILAHRPHVVHFHNVFPLLSPAAYGACHAAGVAVVQTLHNFRPICIGTFLIRNGSTCQLCLNRSSLPGIIHRCYRGSFVASAAAGHMLSVHRRRGTWSTDVDRYIALSEFGRSKFIAAGFPADRIEVKPNFMSDPGRTSHDRPRSGVLYVGRLSPEKGVATLIEACATLQCELRIVGTGPESDALRKLGGTGVVFLGSLDRAAVLEEMRRALVVVVPSIWFESFPMILIEAFACGTPVIASRLGSLAEIVGDNITGRLVAPNDPMSLRECIASLISDPALAARLGADARRVFLERYTPRINLQRLEGIYENAIREFMGASSVSNDSR
jgi:glycosyltransferase involved in cell wall biosynthesis